MAKITLKGNECSTSGELPAVGSKLPAFSLVGEGLNELTNGDFEGKYVVFNIFPSIDTPVCATSVKTFNEKVASLDNAKVACVSMDLPFAFKRFCGAEGIEGVVIASDFRGRKFGQDFGCQIVDGPLAGLYARAIVVANPEGEIVHTELVGEIADEPNYEAALAKLG